LLLRETELPPAAEHQSREAEVIADGIRLGLRLSTAARVSSAVSRMKPSKDER
jgi:hypothetical protein